MPYVQYLVPFRDFTGSISSAVVIGPNRKSEGREHLLLDLPQSPNPLVRHDSIPVAIRGSLCAACESIDLAQIAEMNPGQSTERADYRFQQENIITELNDLSQQEHNLPCPLCQFFRSALACSATVKPGHFQLQAASTRHICVGISGEGLEDNKSSVLLNVRMEVMTEQNETGHKSTITASPVYGYNQTHETPAFHVRALGPEFDEEFARSCLDYCRKEHGEECDTTSHPLIEFQVIDCQARRVIGAPVDCQYVALSYVWGQASSPKLVEKGLPLQDVPITVDDSIEVTLKLGFRYLWVDQYCIDQSDSNKRHTQIQQMNQIYANAQFTIVAAAGTGPDRGLPGVRNSRRERKPVLELGQWTFISTLPDLPAAIGRSTWRTRAWTYQEFLMSKRRIIFAEYQTYFICNMMQCAESLVLPPGEMRVDNDDRDRAGISTGTFGYKIPGRHPHAIMEYISQFSYRKLTYPADALDAMEAIFDAFRRGQRPVYNFKGVPIAHPDTISGISQPRLVEDEGPARIKDVTHDSPFIPSGRSAKEGFLVGLCWQRHDPTTRRDLFPSWTWAGWEGGVSDYSGINMLKASRERFNDVDVYIELEDGSMFPFPDFTDVPPFLEKHSREEFYLHIVAPVIEPSTIELRTPTLCYIQFDVGPERTHPQLQANMDMTWEDGTTLNLSGVCFGTASACWAILIVENMGGHYERRGLVLTQASSAKYDKLDFPAVLKDAPKRDIRLR